MLSYKALADSSSYQVPTAVRTSCSLAMDESGLAVISGGSDEDILCMFGARNNCWENATAKLVSKSSSLQGLGATPTTTLPTESQTGTASAEPTATGSPSAAFPVKILGAVLGSIAGAALVLLTILLLLRWRKKRQEHSDLGHQRRSSGIPNEKDGLEFSDRGLPQMSSTRQFRNHEPHPSAGSFSSMAILMGRVGGHKRGSERGNGSLGSDSSSQFNKKYKAAISNPIPQEQLYGDFGGPVHIRDQKIGPVAEGVTPRPRRGSRSGRRGSTRRSSGWNRYWSGGSALNILGFGTKRTTYGSDSDSQYSDHRQQSQVTQTSALVPPLKLAGQPELNKVPSGSPTVANIQGKYPLSREMSGQIERSGSIGSLSSYNDDDRRDAFSSGVPASVHEQNSWTPVDRHDWNAGRAPTNAYTESMYATKLPRSTVPNFPQPSNFPGPSSRTPLQQSNISDMSWLNLGGESRV
jgi:hypothetical protein